MPPGSAFCGQCGAPQVRIPESLTASPSESANASTTEDSFSGGFSGAALNWRHALPAASSAGFAMAIALMLPRLSMFFPLWMLAGGWLAVVLYRRRSSLLTMTSNIGGKVGALAGLLGFAFFAVFTSALLTVETLVLHRGEQIRSMMRSALDQAVANNPQSQAISQWVQTPEGLALFATISMFLFLVAFLLLSTAGGFFAASAARRKLR